MLSRCNATERPPAWYNTGILQVTTHTITPFPPNISIYVYSRVTFLIDSRKKCFILLSCPHSVVKPGWKTPSYIIEGLHPPSVYQLRGPALASLQAIRARVKCFFPFFLLSLCVSLSFILSCISLCLHLLLWDWGQLALELRRPSRCRMKCICDVC